LSLLKIYLILNQLSVISIFVPNGILGAQLSLSQKSFHLMPLRSYFKEI